MSIYCFTLPGYGYLYRSMLRFCKIKQEDARELCYFLNTANLDSFRYSRKDVSVAEATAFAFNRMLGEGARPYRTEVQLFKAMEALNRNIIYEALTSIQREAVQHMRCLMRDVEYTFYRTFDMDINDRRTVYRECAGTLTPRDDEPGVCLLAEWITLPTA